MKKYTLFLYFICFLNFNINCSKKQLCKVLIRKVSTVDRQPSLGQMQANMYKGSWKNNIKKSLPAIIVPASLYCVGIDSCSVFFITNFIAACYSYYDNKNLKQVISIKDQDAK